MFGEPRAAAAAGTDINLNITPLRLPGPSRLAKVRVST